MSRTFRKIPTRKRQPWLPSTIRKTDKQVFIQKRPDGKRNITVELMRDSRATGLRSHHEDRREAKVVLRTDDEDVLPAGKMRRYSLHFGDYKY